METQLLNMLHKYRDGYISGEELAEKFKVSRTSIWNYIDYFRKQGYTIEAHPHLGYRLVDSPDRMLPDEMLYELGTDIIGRKIYSYEETASTNDVAWELAIKGEPEGSVVFAESQNKGRGRQRRDWFSAKRRNILFSVILRPNILPVYAPMITAYSAVSVARAVAKYTGLSIWIKWPNDIYLDSKIMKNHGNGFGRKAGGILTELCTEVDEMKFAILGIGINVNGSDWPTGLADKAVSLEEAGGMSYKRIELAKEILRSLDKYYKLLLDKKWDDIISEWKDMSIVLGRRVKVVQNSEESFGQAIGLDERGALILRFDNGFIKHMISGDIHAVDDSNNNVGLSQF